MGEVVDLTAYRRSREDASFSLINPDAISSYLFLLALEAARNGESSIIREYEKCMKTDESVSIGLAVLYAEILDDERRLKPALERSVGYFSESDFLNHCKSRLEELNQNAL